MNRGCRTDAVEVDPLVQAVTSAFAAAARALDEEALTALADQLSDLEATRAERICTQLVAISLRLLQADGERAVEMVVQLYVLAECSVGRAVAANHFELVERAFPGIRTERAVPTTRAPAVPIDRSPAPKIRRGIVRE
jgi:hypothetical protein